MVSLWKNWSEVTRFPFILTGGMPTSQNVLPHIHKNTVSDVIRKPNNVVDNLVIMRLDLSFYIPLT